MSAAAYWPLATFQLCGLGAVLLTLAEKERPGGRCEHSRKGMKLTVAELFRSVPAAGGEETIIFPKLIQILNEFFLPVLMNLKNKTDSTSNL